MIRGLLVCSGFLLSLAWPASAGGAPPGAAGLPVGPGEPSGLVLTAAAKDGTSWKFRCHVERLATSEIDTPRGRFTAVSIPGFPTGGAIGAPALPVLNRLVEVPLGGELAVTADGGVLREIRLDALGLGHPVLPRQPPLSKGGAAPPFAYEPAAYVTAGLYQDEPVSVEDLGVLRDRRLVLLKVAPVAYDPVARRLELTNDLRVTLTVRGADAGRTRELQERYGSSFFPAAGGRQGRDAGPAGYAVVADRMFQRALEPFVQWKTARGFNVAVGYTDTVGKTPEAIRAWVRGLYASPPPGATAPVFLLLVGDHEQVPSFPGKTGEHLSDLYYATMTEGDWLPDILVGRFSARTVEELAPQVDKTLEYEQLRMPDLSFLRSTVLIAGWDSARATEWGWPQVNYGARNVFDPAHGLTGTRAFLSSASQQNSRQIVAQVGLGCAVVNYTAHGSNQRWTDPQFSVFDVEELRNHGKYPLVIGNCCLTNAFQLDRCFGEAWLRAKGKGAIGYIGASDNSNWDEDVWWAVGLYPILHPNPAGAPPERAQVQGGALNALVQPQRPCNAGLMVAGNLSVEQSNSFKRQYYWEIYHLMGDPSLRVFLGQPRENAVAFPARLDAGAGTLEVQAPAGASVAVSQNGRLLGAGTGAGAIRLAPAPAPGDLHVVVTGTDLRPFIGRVTVAP